MIRFIFRIAMVVCSLALLAGCGSAPKSVKKDVQSPVQPVTCIGILPAAAGVDTEGQSFPEMRKTLIQGVKVMNSLLSQELSGHEKIVFITEEHISGLRLTGGENPKEIARMVGERINCSAILETTIRRYTERVGTKWSVEQPASVAFDFRLIDAGNGNLLWSARFDEEQIPVMDNLYNWSKAQTRGFTWITADELMREGMSEKIANSPYFKQVTKIQTQGGSADDLDYNRY